MKIASKIGVLVAGLTCGLVALCAVALWQLQATRAANERTYKAETLATSHLADANSALWALRWGIAQYIALNDADKRKALLETDKRHDDASSIGSPRRSNRHARRHRTSGSPVVIRATRWIPIPLGRSKAVTVKALREPSRPQEATTDPMTKGTDGERPVRINRRATHLAQLNLDAARSLPIAGT